MGTTSSGLENSASHIEAIPVIHLVEFIPRLEVAQLGIGQQESYPSSIPIPC